MTWAGTSISPYELPIRGRRVKLRWLPTDETIYLDYNEDLYGDLI